MRIRCLTIRTRLIGAFSALTLMLFLLGALALYGIHKSDRNIYDIYNNRLLAVSQMAHINDLMRQNVHHLMVALISRAATENIKRYTDTVQKNLNEIDANIAEYLKGAQITNEERSLAEEWIAKKNIYVTKSVNSSMQQMLDGKFTDAEDNITAIGKKHYNKAQEVMDKLLEVQMNTAKETYELAQKQSIMSKQVISIILGVVVVFFLIGSLIVRSITKPISNLVKDVNSVANGNVNVPISGIARTDEIRPLANALENWRLALIESHKQEEERQGKNARRIERQRKIEERTKQFEETIINMLERVRAAISNLHLSADTLTGNATKTQEQIDNVAQTTSRASENIQSVAQSGEQLLNSIQNLTEQVHRSADTAKIAAEEAVTTNTKINNLSETTQRIGEIVGLISQIASQTNLLALNATIESARAGEMGKGFAVVANEVKNLSSKTSQATKNIADQITSVQEQTAATVKATESISHAVQQFDEITDQITVALEEQTKATGSISLSAEHASSGMKDISTSLNIVVRSAHETDKMAKEVLVAANDLMEESGTIESEIRRFLVEVQQIK